MSANGPGFQVLPGATPENSAFIDLYFDPSVSVPWKSPVPITVNGWQMRLSTGQSVRIAVPPGQVTVVVDLFVDLFASKPRLQFAVQPGQVVPVFYRSSLMKGDPGALSFVRIHGLSRSEKGSLLFVLVPLAFVLGISLLLSGMIWFIGAFPH